MPGMSNVSLPSMPGMSNVSLPSMPGMSNVSLPSMPGMSNVSLPSMPGMSNVSLPSMPGMSNVSLPSMPGMSNVSLPSMLGIVTGLASLWGRVGSHFKNPPKIPIFDQIVLYMMGLLMLSTYLFLMLYATFNNAYGEIGTNSEEIEKLNSERRNSLYMWFSLLLIAIIPYILWLIPLLDFSNGKLITYIKSLKICVIIVSVISFFISR